MASFLDSWLNSAQDAIGVPAAGLRLLLTSFLVFPVILVHRRTLRGRDANLQHAYFTLCGLLLVYFNFGSNVAHVVANVLVVYAVLLALGGSAASVAICFVINIGYLMACYWVTKKEVYDLSWSIPLCVLTLRLTGLAWDVYDGQVAKASASAAAGKKKSGESGSVPADTLLHSVPSLLEVFGYCFFTPSFMTGPQFPMTRYLNFIQGQFSDKANAPSCLREASLRTAAGIIYIAVYALFGSKFPSSYLLSDEFQETAFIYKVVYTLLWGQVLLTRYIGLWLLAEGGCILSGIAYNGTDSAGSDQWNACANVRIRKFVLAVTFQDIVDSFNVNTNQWMLKYVYKRLRFLGNRHISHAATLLYLAVWHGYQSGYFMNFFLEFLMVSCEKDVSEIIEHHASVKRIVNNRYLRPFMCLLSKFIVMFSLSYALISFDFLHYNKYMKVYGSLHYVLHLVFLLWPIAYASTKAISPKSRKRSENGVESKAD